MTWMSSDFQNLEPLTVKNKGIPTAWFGQPPERGNASLVQSLLFLSLPFPQTYWFTSESIQSVLLKGAWEFFQEGCASNCFFSPLYLGKVRNPLEITSGLLFLTRLCSSTLQSHCRHWNMVKFSNFFLTKFRGAVAGRGTPRSSSLLMEYPDLALPAPSLGSNQPWASWETHWDKSAQETASTECLAD